MRRLPLALAVSLLLGVVAWREGRATPARALRVTGRAALSGVLIPTDGGMAVRASLRDEAGRPVRAAKLTLRAVAKGQPITSLETEPCPDATTPASGDTSTITTNDAGDACVILAGTAAERVHLGYRHPKGLLASMELSLLFDRARRSLRLRFAPKPGSLNLDRPQATISVETDVLPSSPPMDEPLLVELALREPKGKPIVLAQLPVRPGDRGNFVVRSEQLGQPGPAELSAIFTGSAGVHPETRSVQVSRVVTTELGLAAKPGTVTPSEGFDVQVSIDSATGAVPAGSVEAQVAGNTVGIAPVDNGMATVTVRYELQRPESPLLTLRYLPDSPWYRPGAPLSVEVAVTPPSRLRQLPWVVAVLLAALWVLSAWRRPPRRIDEAGVSAKRPAGRPLLELLQPSPTGKGWSGTVVDAHDGDAIPGAQLALVEPGFEKIRVLATARTDELGRFELAEPSDSSEGMRLEVAALWHSSLVRPAPRRGQVVVQLVHRRRAILSRLVHWAKSRGWRKHGDPTPGLLARTAHEKNRSDVEQWAGLVERAAYGPEAPTEQEEREISHGEPR
jgi:hypothetical protein